MPEWTGTAWRIRCARCRATTLHPADCMVVEQPHPPVPGRKGSWAVAYDCPVCETVRRQRLPLGLAATMVQTGVLARSAPSRSVQVDLPLLPDPDVPPADLPDLTQDDVTDMLIDLGRWDGLLPDTLAA